MTKTYLRVWKLKTSNQSDKLHVESAEQIAAESAAAERAAAERAAAQQTAAMSERLDSKEPKQRRKERKRKPKPKQKRKLKLKQEHPLWFELFPNSDGASVSTGTLRKRIFELRKKNLWLVNASKSTFRDTVSRLIDELDCDDDEEVDRDELARKTVSVNLN